MFSGIIRGFQVGCGVDFAQAVRSARYQELLESELSLAERFPVGTDQGTALRAGVRNMGMLLNSGKPEQEALAQAAALGCAPRSYEMRALIRLLGETVVAEAGKCLPQEAIDMAEQWKTAGAEEQIGIAGKLCHLFIDEQQRRGQGSHPTFENVQRHLLENLEHNLDFTDERVLPRLYGKWGQGGRPNCQGKTQMIIAFARLANAPVLAVSPVLSAHKLKSEWQQVVLRRIKRDLIARNLMDAEPEFSEGILADEMRLRFELNKPDFFHVGAALKLRDGRWVMVDPHVLTWGVFSDSYGMDRVEGLLAKYGEVVPGISIQASDTESPKRLQAEKMEELESLLDRSRRLEEKLRAAGQDIFAVIQAYSDFGEPEFAMKESGVDVETLRTALDPVQISMMTFLGLDGPSLEMFVDPQGFLNRRIGVAVTYAHCIAANRFRDQDTLEGRMIHPVCELGLAEYHTAIALFNTLEEASTARNRFFLDHSFDQVTFHNLINWGSMDSETAKAAAEAVATLPFVHPSTKLALEAYLWQERMRR